MATGEIRAAFSLSEPELGSDVQAIKTSAKKGDDGTYEINGQKMWVTNGLLSSLVFVLVKTDPDAEPRHKGFTCFIAEKEPGVGENTGEYAGLNVPPKIKKLGYKGVESTELVFDGYRCPAENILGGEEAGPEQGLRADDGRARGRPRERRRPRRRHRPARARARAALLAGAQDVRQADRRAPGDPVQARRHGHAGRRRAAAHAARRAPEGRRRALGPRGRHGQAVRLRGGPLLRRGVPSASTAATATPRSTRSSASTATRRCC